MADITDEERLAIEQMVNEGKMEQLFGEISIRGIQKIRSRTS